MTAIVLRGDARALPLPDASVDLIVTSPPYFGLRSYTDGGEHYASQIGSEATPQEWVAALVECTREWMRVLKPSGSMFVNLGDKYSTTMHSYNYRDPGTYTRKTPQPDGEWSKSGWHGKPNVQPAAQEPGMQPKSLLGLPWRYALAATDQLGLILRRDIIWCLSGGARVYARTPTGDRPVMLRDLVRSYQPENVQLWNGQRWTQVLGWNRSPDRDGALELELRTGERIGCTPGHRWPTQRGVIRADEIRVGDVLQITQLPEPPAHHPALLPYDDIGWLVGLYIAEGSRSGTTIQFAGHVREEARHVRLARIAAALDGTCTVYRTGGNTATCNLNGPVIAGVIDRYVSPGTAKTKRLKLAAWQRSNSFLGAVVDGYLEGDGHFDAKNGRWRLGFTQNDEWAADLRTLAARLGTKLSLRRAEHVSGGQRFPGWRGEWRWTRPMHWNAKDDGEVVAIRASRARDFFDVGVADEPHLFALASGVLTHNSKPNGLPESVTDRCRSSHEYLFHLVRQPRYYAAVDEIRESAAYNGGGTGRVQAEKYGAAFSETRLAPSRYHAGDRSTNPLGKLPGSVWNIPSQPLTVPAHLGVSHFAAFPFELPRRCVLGWSPPGICVACGEGRRPVTYLGRGSSLATITGYACACTPCTDHPGTGESSGPLQGPYRGQPHAPNFGAGSGTHDNLSGRPKVGPWREYDLNGWTPPPTRPAVILDPFGGTGTTALVASMLGRVGVSVDRSADYTRLARWRTTDPGERAKALQVPKPPKQLEGQEPLWPATVFGGQDSLWP